MGADCIGMIALIVKFTVHINAQLCTIFNFIYSTLSKGKIVIKSGGPLRPGEIANTWHMMKNQNPSYFVQRYPMVILETWWDFFPQIFFLNPKNKFKPVSLPHVLKTPENNVSHSFSSTSLCLIRIIENAVFNLEICH